MGNPMTFAAYAIFLMDRGTMRFTMAFLAGRKLPMGRMTLRTGQLRMFCLMILQLLIRNLMAPGANLFGLVQRVGYLQWCMYRMAGKAVGCLKHSQGAMVFMTFSALRNTAVFFRVTGRAFLLRMLAYFLLQACCNRFMTELAATFQVYRCRYGD
jgi:hypothetical protein